MNNEISDSLKVKLYDYSYSPFMGSFIISWIALNHKYILIYFSTMENITKKLELLDLYGNNAIVEHNLKDPILPIFDFL